MSSANNRSTAEIVSKIGRELLEQVDDSSPSLKRCQELIEALQENKMTISILQKSQIGKTLSKTIKGFRRHKRTAAGGDAWNKLIDSSQTLLKGWKEAADAENEKRKKGQNCSSDDDNDDAEESLPTSTSVYRARLTRHGKELYKDPPALPPGSVVVEDSKCPLPKRDKSTGALTFVAGEDNDLKKLLKDFHPNRTPEEVLRAGSFGGTYFRPIVSAVTNKRYNASEVLKDTVVDDWIAGLDKKTMLTSSTYKPQVNKFGVKCGGSLGMWESSGWIADSDPYGWFQWYCRFYQGRRCSDDARQISRWLKSAGPKGRFRSQLCNKILAANTSHDDASISPVIRQTMLHWGLEITSAVLDQHKKRVK